MSKTAVAIVDYGSGNLRSAEKAFQRAISDAGLKATVTVTSDADKVAAASHIVLPGVGAFGDCRRGLDAVDGMVAALTDAVLRRGQPFLGICVGMQLMATVGLEHGNHPGLNWIPGQVVPLKPSDGTIKIPHMGWNTLNYSENSHAILQEIPVSSDVYFVHSFAFACEHPNDVIASSDYGGPFTAIVGRDTMVGTQFHPEKSQAMGLQLIKNFVQWRP